MLQPRKEPFIEFVTGRQDLSSKHLKKKDFKKVSEKSNLSGNDVRNFYESVISEDCSHLPCSQSTKNAPEKIKVKRKVCRDSKDDTRIKKGMKKNEHDSIDHQHGSSTCDTDIISRSRLHTRHTWKLETKLLLASQNGDAELVKQCVSEGVNINAQDQFGWTALMCASYAGHADVLIMLLKLGASKEVCESRGQTARDLAELAGHTEVLKIIDGFSSFEKQNELNSCVSKKFYCDVCESWFSEESVTSHATSTIHLFNCQLEPKKPDFMITESNIGYQMMLRNGWDSSSGLGPDGRGQKYPVKTVLKRNRKGLGEEETATPRVTHFKPKDIQAVKSVKSKSDRQVSVRTMSRRAMRRKELKGKEWERKLRQYMNSD